MQFSNFFPTFVFFCTVVHFVHHLLSELFKNSENMLWETNKNFKEACCKHWFNLTLPVLCLTFLFMHTHHVYNPVQWYTQRHIGRSRRFFLSSYSYKSAPCMSTFLTSFESFFLSVKLAYQSWRERGGRGAKYDDSKTSHVPLPKIFSLHCKLCKVLQKIFLLSH